MCIRPIRSERLMWLRRRLEMPRRLLRNGNEPSEPIPETLHPKPLEPREDADFPRL